MAEVTSLLRLVEWDTPRLLMCAIAYPRVYNPPPDDCGASAGPCRRLKSVAQRQSHTSQSDVCGTRIVKLRAVSDPGRRSMRCSCLRSFQPESAIWTPGGLRLRVENHAHYKRCAPPSLVTQPPGVY